jgi:hypothetical protein
MTIQASGRSALLVAALIAASTLGFAGASTAYAAGNGTMQVSAEPTSDGTTAVSATPDANAAPAAEQTTPAAPSPFAANTVAENTGTSAAAEATDAAANTVAVSNDDSSGWDKASIIGKIFIACGTLLTLGSAARMFMI